MIPHTFPSVPNAINGDTEMVVYFLSSVSGLTRWVDYIPVKTVSEDRTVVNTTNAGGYQPINILSSISGKTAWVDYIPVYEDAAATIPFNSGASGYIPVYGAGSSPVTNYFILLEDGVSFILQEDGTSKIQLEA